MKLNFIPAALLFILMPVLLKANPEPPPPLANTTTLSGFVRDSISKETLIGATIYIADTKLGAYTNKSGFFSISGITPGKRKVAISSIGYNKKIIELDFKANQSFRYDFEMNESELMSEQVNIEAEREADKRQITISRVNIPIEQIKEIRIGGEADVFRSLQYLPGILTSSQISSGLYIRGGSPDQNLVLLDGSTVYNPTHLFGFISTFNSDAIKDVELIKGGFPAEYGGRLSSVLNITQKDGNRDHIEGIGAIGMISSKLALEGPLGNGSWFISGRRTYFELIKGLIEEDPVNPIPDFNFYDINAKITQDWGDNDKFYASGFLSKDNLDFESFGTNFGLEVGNSLGSLRWTHIFGDNLFSNFNFSYSKYFNNFKGDQSGYEFLIENSITDYAIKNTYEWFTSEEITSKFGFEMSSYTFDYLQNFTGDTDSTSEGAQGAELNFTIKDYNYSIFAQTNYNFIEPASLQAGIRANYWEESDIFTLAPRIALRYEFMPNMAIKAAWGMYFQNLRLATQPDFSFFDTWLPTDSTLPESRSIHYIVSFETMPIAGYDLNFDVYYKTLKNINELKRTALEGENVDDVFFIGEGESYGIELFVQKKIGKFTGWFGYALGWINARFDSVNQGREFRPKYDRRHDFKFVGQYEINENWSVGANFTFQSGQSYTGATSSFWSRLPDMNFGRGKIIPSQRYGLRLPPSHQLNVNASYYFKTFGLDSRVILDIYNVYNRRDIWFRFYDTSTEEIKVEDIRLLPIIPTFTYEIKF